MSLSASSLRASLRQNLQGCLPMGGQRLDPLPDKALVEGRTSRMMTHEPLQPLLAARSTKRGTTRRPRALFAPKSLPRLSSGPARGIAGSLRDSEE